MNAGHKEIVRGLLSPAARRPPLIRRPATHASLAALALLGVGWGLHDPLKRAAAIRALAYAHLEDYAWQTLIAEAPTLHPAGARLSKSDAPVRANTLRRARRGAQSRRKNRAAAPLYVWQSFIWLDENWAQRDFFSPQQGWLGSVACRARYLENASAANCMPKMWSYSDDIAIGDFDADGRPEVMLGWRLGRDDRSFTERLAYLNIGRRRHELLWACEVTYAVPALLTCKRVVDRDELALDLALSGPRGQKSTRRFRWDAAARVFRLSSHSGDDSLVLDFVLWKPPAGRSVRFRADRPLDDVLAEVLPAAADAAGN